MINYELFRRNFDSERLAYIITELLLLLRQLLLRRASLYGNRHCRVSLSCCGAVVAVARY